MTHIPRIRPKVRDTLIWIGIALVMSVLACVIAWTLPLEKLG